LRWSRPSVRSSELRATVSEETFIKAAAERQGVRACEKAERTLADQTRFVLDDKQWKAFTAALDRPARSKPRLRRLFAEPHVAQRHS
jgi:uncharacterized protein (DUF1778 family)